MARLNPGRFAFGLVAEITGIVLIVTVLPRIPWGAASTAGSGEDIADQRPSLVTPTPALSTHQHWRVAPGHQQELPVAAPEVDPAYVERRLDRAGQQLLSGVSTYVAQTAREVLDSRAHGEVERAIVPAPSTRPFPPSFTSPDPISEGNWRY
jgi:hypothetical protein